MLAKITIGLCLAAAVATVGIALPGDYLPLKVRTDYLFMLLLVGPYMLIGTVAWRVSNNRRASMALLVLTVLVVVGVAMIGLESAHYRATIATHPRGAEYMKERYQRMAVFLVPTMQWFVALLAGGAVLLQELFAGRPAAPVVETNK